MKIPILLVLALIPILFATLLATHRASPVTHYSRTQHDSEIHALRQELSALQSQGRSFLPRGGR